jgi:hypothetical protein
MNDKTPVGMNVRTSVRRKRAGGNELLEQLDHFRLAGNFWIQKRTHRR